MRGGMEDCEKCRGGLKPPKALRGRALFARLPFSPQHPSHSFLIPFSTLPPHSPSPNPFLPNPARFFVPLRIIVINRWDALPDILHALLRNTHQSHAQYPHAQK